MDIRGRGDGRDGARDHRHPEGVQGGPVREEIAAHRVDIRRRVGEVIGAQRRDHDVGPHVSQQCESVSEIRGALRPARRRSADAQVDVGDVRFAGAPQPPVVQRAGAVVAEADGVGVTDHRDEEPVVISARLGEDEAGAEAVGLVVTGDLGAQRDPLARVTDLDEGAADEYFALPDMDGKGVGEDLAARFQEHAGGAAERRLAGVATGGADCGGDGYRVRSRSLPPAVVDPVGVDEADAVGRSLHRVRHAGAQRGNAAVRGVVRDTDGQMKVGADRAQSERPGRHRRRAHPFSPPAKPWMMCR